MLNTYLGSINSINQINLKVRILLEINLDKILFYFLTIEYRNIFTRSRKQNYSTWVFKEKNSNLLDE